MNAAAYVGRVGELAVALGIGVALVNGAGLAMADTPSSGSSSESSESSQSKTSGSASNSTAPESDTKPDAKPDTKPTTTSTDTTNDPTPPTDSSTDPATPANTTSTSTGSTTTEAPPGVTVSTGGAHTSSKDASSKDTGGGTTKDPVDQPKSTSGSDQPAQTSGKVSAVGKVGASEVKVEDDAQAAVAKDDKDDNDSVPESSPAARTMSAMTTQSAVTTAATEPVVASTRPWPTAFDPGTAITYVTGLVSSLVSAVLSPFAAGGPPLPTDPAPWTLLAWVRRELFNESPTITNAPDPYGQSLNSDGDVVITGNIGASDPDGDHLTYTVVGRPQFGGVVDIDDDGNFTYRPMNAMAAVGGEDQFTVVVSDEAAGLHVHGLMGLLKFVPILGNFLNPGSGDRVARTITVKVAPVAGVDLSFPTDFHWGVAHAGFQAEGGPGSPVDPNSDWYKWVHDPINQLLGLTNGVPENGPGTYVTYDSDAQLAHDDLGMNTFRMGIEWTRIFPNSTAAVNISDEGGTVSLSDLQALDALANQDEVAHYRAVFASLRAHGLEPLVTVNHFTLPTWVNDPTTTRPLAQLGLPAPEAGWLSPDTPVEFEKYAAYLAWKYGDQVDNWATINEPVSPILTEFFAIPTVVPSWPPGLIRPDLASTFLINQAKGHVAAYDAIHLWDTTVATAGQPAAFVGFTNNMIPARPANPVNPLDVQAADAWNAFYNGWFPNAVVDGWVDANLDGIQTPDEMHADMADKVDWIGVQYYGSQPMQGFGVAPVPGFPFLRGLPVRCTPSPTCSDFNQPTDPGGFREVLEFAASYGKPLWVTENGIADSGDSKRPSYIVNHIAVVQDMVAHGMDIRGYTYWSFVDNLEWAEGYDLHFGLYGSDPTTPELERTPKPDSIAAISQITKSPTHSLPLSLLGLYLPGVV
jgi:beta-galactosidase